MKKILTASLLAISLIIIGSMGCNETFSSSNIPVSGEVIGRIPIDTDGSDEDILIVYDRERNNFCYILERGTRSEGIECIPNLERSEQ